MHSSMAIEVVVVRDAGHVVQQLSCALFDFCHLEKSCAMYYFARPFTRMEVACDMTVEN